MLVLSFSSVSKHHRLPTIVSPLPNTIYPVSIVTAHLGHLATMRCQLDAQIYAHVTNVCNSATYLTHDFTV